MQATRRQKNRALILVNGLLLPIVWWEIFEPSFSLGAGMVLWAFLTPPILVLTLLGERVEKLSRWTKSIHMGLFLATGTAIGLTIGAMLREFETLPLGRLLWLPLGLAAAVYHYSPSHRDEYSR